MWSDIYKTEAGYNFFVWLEKEHLIDHQYANNFLVKVPSENIDHAYMSRLISNNIINALAIEWLLEKKIFVDVSCNLIMTSSDFGTYNIGINNLENGDSLYYRSMASCEYKEAIASGVKKGFELLTNN